MSLEIINCFYLCMTFRLYVLYVAHHFLVAKYSLANKTVKMNLCVSVYARMCVYIQHDTIDGILY